MPPTLLSSCNSAAVSPVQPADSPPAAIVRGYTGTQIFNTAGATTSTGEEPICGVLGGASQWISFVAEETGTLVLNTDGSSYDTVVAVLKRSPTNGVVLVQAACDNNSGPDGRDSALSVPVEAGKTNFIVVDGVNSAVGILKLNYSLVTPARLTSLGFNLQKAQVLRFTGRPLASFSIQGSANLASWTTLVTTNALAGVHDYTDLSSTNAPIRFYRAVLLP